MTGRFDAADEDRAVAEVTRVLERLDFGPGVSAPADFTERVMAAVRAEPLPEPARAFTVAIAAGRLRAAAGAVSDAWRVMTRGFAPVAIRAQALALVLVIAGLGVALAGGAAVGAMSVLSPQPRPSQPLPNVAPPSASPPPSVSASSADSPLPTGGPTAEATGSASPSESPDPTETAEPTHTEDHSGRGSRATLAPGTSEPTDDHGGSSGSSDSGSGSGDSGRSGSGGGGPTETPSATEGHSGSSDG